MRITRGDLRRCDKASAAARLRRCRPEKSAEAVVGRLAAEGLNLKTREGTLVPVRDAEPEKKIEISEADQRGQGRKPEAAQASGSNFPGRKEQADPKQPDLIERMLERGNMLKGLQAVEANRGAAGVDGMEVKQLRSYLREHWAEIREQILNGTYEPRPVRRVDIPKPGGGTRMLGIPTVLDRLIQQAIHQILSPLWERGSQRTASDFGPDAVRHRRSKRHRVTFNPASAG